jgi:hypothetical protein
MIFAKINPVASKVLQTTPFTTTTITADTMTAIARPYKLGSENTRFELVFGNLISGNTENNEIKFNQIMNSEITLSSTQLQNWGSDDSVVLTIIATALGVNVDGFITANVNSF